VSIASEPPLSPTDPKELRQAFGTFATGVTVVTVGGSAPHGMTANSFTSVSLDPPLVLICIDRDAVMHSSLDTVGHFGVSVLSTQQEDVARHFSNRWRPLGAAQFEGVDWRPGRYTGTPLIAGALAAFECEQWRAYDGGDHTIFVGKVLGLDRDSTEDALLFFKGRFAEVSAALAT
jgi:flavin reductase (DIM6/NTAB) family NADH-FMN oxidoreductase RutF